MIQSTLSRKMSAASNQVEMINVLLKELKLPDPTKRAGLKKIASDFVRYDQRINSCYDAHNRPTNRDVMVLTTILNLWAKLGLDAIIRDRLINGGVLQRIAPLLKNDYPEAIHQSVLFALSIFTHHGGHQARKLVAELTAPSIIDLLDKPNCQLAVTRLGVAVLAHTLSAAVTEGEEDHYEGDEVRVKIPPALRNMNNVRMLSSVGRAMRWDKVDEDLLYHGLDILRTMAFNYRKAMLETSSQLPLAAALASPNIQIRLIGFIGLLRLGSSITEMEGRSVNSLHIWEVATNMEEHFTPRLLDAMRKQYGGLYGGMITEIKESGLGVGPSGLSFGGSGDHVHIGRELCKKILEKEYSLGAAAIYGMGADGLFARATHALRSSPNPADAHLPAILDIKLAIAVGDRGRICSLSNHAIQRFPEVGFFYYACAIWTEESRLALRLSKKGLACPGLTDYVKRGLLFKSAEAGYEMIVNGVLDHAQPGSPAWREGLAILHCTREDSKAYIEMTPMDQKSMKTVLYIYLATTLILEGDRVFGDFGRVKPYLEKLRIAEDIFEVVIGPVPHTQRKVAIDTIESLFATKMDDWREVIARLDKPRRGYVYATPSLETDESNPDQILANWLARTELEDEDVPRSDYAELGYSDELYKTREDNVVMYRCSLCGNPSASLKRCAKCKSARYCDEDCQKKHWKKGHKLTCKPPTITP
ncbi:unnamed protein product [Rhizoctonia solani]|nr:unnamed protein product [Rhizoctonia solani]